MSFINTLWRGPDGYLRLVTKETDNSITYNIGRDKDLPEDHPSVYSVNKYSSIYWRHRFTKFMGWKQDGKYLILKEHKL